MYLNPTLNYELYKIASQNVFKPGMEDFVYMTKLALALGNSAQQMPTSPTAPNQVTPSTQAPPPPVTPAPQPPYQASWQAPSTQNNTIKFPKQFG